MSTTDILFNSPALHSLKRAQLVQLCKRHNIKASGKNTELVSRLKSHARGLPSGTPLSVAVRSEREGLVDGDGDTNAGMMTDISDEDDIEEQLTSPDKVRESQMWEIVSRGSVESKRSFASFATAGRTGEFGATSNSKSTILKSIANSIGLTRSSSSNSLPVGESSDSLAPPMHKKDKDPSSSPKPRSMLSSLLPRSRSNSHESQTKGDARKSLMTNAVPYHNIPMPTVSRRPQIEPFAFSYAGAEDTSLVSDVSMTSLDRPVPGLGPYPSINVNNGAGTIRLITSTSKPPEEAEDVPKLTPVIPAFDLVPPTPGKARLHRFPISETPEANRTLYPVINSDDMTVDLDVLTSPTKPSKQVMDKSLPSLPEISPISPTSPKDAFIFGSPNPRHSTAALDFSHAASSVLAEMNARLGAVGAPTIDTGVLAHASGQLPKSSVEELLKYEFGGASGDGKNKGGKDGNEGSMSSKFKKLHEKEFSRMEGIDTHYAAKRSLRGKEKTGKVKESEAVELDPLPDNRKRKQSVLHTGKTSASAPSKKKQSMVARIGGKEKAPEKKLAVVIPGAFEADEMEVDESMTRTEVSEEHEDEQDEDNGRGAKRACVTEPAADGSGETRRISIAPKVRKDTSDDEDEVDGEKKRKQNEAIKRRLELNKARRRSSRGRPSMAPRTPIQKQKSFLSSAKSFVKSVWNRGGNSTVAKSANTSGPSYLRATASSAGRTLEQDSKASQAIDTKAPATRPSILRNSSVGSGPLPRKASGTKAPPAPGSSLQTIAEGEKAPTALASQAQSTKPSGPLFGSVRPRKPSVAPSVARIPSGSGPHAASSTTATVRSSRLFAPTASSLAKASPTKAAAASSTNTSKLRGKVPSVRAGASVMSPSKIPIFSPPQRKSQSVAHSGKRIFGSPLVLPSSPQARSAQEKGQDINPITGAVTPQRQRVPFSSTNGQMQSLMGAATTLKKDSETDADREKGKEQNKSPGKINNALNSLRKPNVSRSKVISRLGAHRDLPGSSQAPHSPSRGPGASATGSVVNKGPVTPKVRSSTGVAARRSLGGQKARENGANPVVLSAKKRARTTEYARRRSTKMPARGPDFTKGHSGDAMEVDG